VLGAEPVMTQPEIDRRAAAALENLQILLTAGHGVDS
jgi:hypothetical protein